jgi:hypothetical protein
LSPLKRNLLALEGRGRVLGDVEHVRLLGVLVQLFVAEVDAGGMSMVMSTLPVLAARSTTMRAVGLGELAAPDRHAHVVGFEARVGVVRVDLVGVGGGAGEAGAGGEGGGNQELEFHEYDPLVVM